MMRGSSGDPILNAVVDLRAAKRPFALATVIETRGSVSAKTGAKAVIEQNGRVVTGWVGGASSDGTVPLTPLERPDGFQREVRQVLIDAGRALSCSISEKRLATPQWSVICPLRTRMASTVSNWMLRRVGAIPKNSPKCVP